jgi:hypothetical protein
MNTNIVGRFCETPTEDWRLAQTPYNLFVSIAATWLEPEPAG